MKSDLTFNKFSEVNRHRCESNIGFNHQLNSWTSSDWMTAVVGEVGEAANVVKKLNRIRDGIPGNKLSKTELLQQLKEELGDVFIYFDLFVQSLGYSVQEIIVEAFNNKSKEIGYPHIIS